MTLETDGQVGENLLTATGVLEHVSLHRFVVNLVLHIISLINAERRQTVQHPGVHGTSPIGNDANHDLFPTVWSPDFALLPRSKMRDILHYTVQRPAEENFVLVVHGDDNE